MNPIEPEGLNKAASCFFFSYQDCDRPSQGQQKFLEFTSSDDSNLPSTNESEQRSDFFSCMWDHDLDFGTFKELQTPEIFDEVQDFLSSPEPLFIHRNEESEQISKEETRSQPIYPLNEDNIIVEEEITTGNSTPEKKSPSREKKEKVPNRLRNAPEVVKHRVIAELIDYLETHKSLQGIRNHFIEIVDTYFPNYVEQKAFLKYLKTFEQSGSKTWKTLRKSLEGKSHLMNCVLLKCVESFLSEEGEMSLEYWFDNGRLGDQTKTDLRDNRVWFVETMEKTYPFRQIVDDVFDFHNYFYHYY